MVNEANNVELDSEGIYLLHFDPRYKHAGHYLGYADNIRRRIALHRKGQSKARLTTAAAAAGVQMVLARIWAGADRNKERLLKGRGQTGKAHRGSLAKICPICKEHKRAQIGNRRKSRSALSRQCKDV